MGKKTTAIARPDVPASQPRPAKEKRTAAAKAVSVKPSTTRAKGAIAPSKPYQKAAPKSTRAQTASYSESDVALRAYFIAEKRQREGLPGDTHQDWIEAERQLAAEAGKRKKAAPKKA